MVAAVGDLYYAPRASDPLLRTLRRTEDGVDQEHGDSTLHDDLTAIGAKLGRPIVVPERPFTEEERQAIAMLRAILHTGRLLRTWTSMTFAMPVEAARRILDTFGGGAICALGGESAEGETVELFGTRLPLGPMRFKAPQARLVNEQAVRARLAARPDPAAAIELNFAPGEDNALDLIYLDWLSSTGPSHTTLMQPTTEAEGPAAGAVDWPAGVVSESRRLQGRWRLLATTRPLGITSVPPNDSEQLDPAEFVIVPSRVVAALDQLDDVERESVFAALRVLQRSRPGNLPALPIKRLAVAEPLYILRTSPRVRVIVRLAEQAPVEVVDVVRPEALQSMFRER